MEGGSGGAGGARGETMSDLSDLTAQACIEQAAEQTLRKAEKQRRMVHVDLGDGYDLSVYWASGSAAHRYDFFYGPTFKRALFTYDRKLALATILAICRGEGPKPAPVLGDPFAKLRGPDVDGDRSLRRQERRNREQEKMEQEKMG